MEKESGSIIGGIEETIRNAQKDSRDLSESDRQERVTRAVEAYAKENNLWTPADEIDLGTPFPSGNENEVYYNESDGYVYKANNLFNAKSIPALLDQVKTHNELFPETKLELTGFTGFDGRSVLPVFKQLFINTGTEASPQEIESFMGKLGFKKIGDAKFTNGQYEVSDLHPRNVLKDEAGDLYVIDNIIKPANPVSSVKQAESNPPWSSGVPGYKSFGTSVPANDDSGKQLFCCLFF